jgi:hypothetical protein
MLVVITMYYLRWDKRFGFVDVLQMRLYGNHYNRRQGVGILEHHHFQHAWDFFPLPQYIVYKMSDSPAILRANNSEKGHEN